MAEHVELANTFFTLLALLANAAVVATVVALLVAWLVPGSRPALRAFAVIVGDRGVVLAFLVALIATAGSLYYSEVANFKPCVLCWYQRICMYPLVAILGIGALRRDRGAGWYALPFVVIGPVISTYHVLIERYPTLGGSLSCDADAPCTVPWFTELGFVTIAYMALSAFLLIAALLVVTAVAARVGSDLEADDDESAGGDDSVSDSVPGGKRTTSDPRTPELTSR